MHQKMQDPEEDKNSTPPTENGEGVGLGLQPEDIEEVIDVQQGEGTFRYYLFIVYN